MVIYIQIAYKRVSGGEKRVGRKRIMGIKKGVFKGL